MPVSQVSPTCVDRGLSESACYWERVGQDVVGIFPVGQQQQQLSATKTQADKHGNGESANLLCSEPRKGAAALELPTGRRRQDSHSANFEIRIAATAD